MSQERSDSLCWDCANCSPLRCDWVARHEKVWDEAIKHERMAHGKPYTTQVVVKCSNYVVEKED